VNLDKTFCTGKRCSKTDRCDRHIKRVAEFFATEFGKQFLSKPISVAEFSPIGNYKCTKFIKREEAYKLKEVICG
jgi:hypothetical protein